jgi:prevent-host-death family protein
LPTETEPLAAPEPEPSKDFIPKGQPRTIPAGEFKAKCLKLMEEVAASREPIIITKFGKPVAQIVPLPNHAFDIIGAMRGSVLWEGDIVSPMDVEWEAMQ